LTRRLKKIPGEDVLSRLLLLDDRVCPGNSMEQRATMLQIASETLVASDKELHAKARKAYTSFVNFYSTYPRAMKRIFSNKAIHLGHYAKSFGLRESPSDLARESRKVAEREKEKGGGKTNRSVSNAVVQRKT
jgi:ATP-dependent RNA helicase DDX31/DBP7